MKKIFVTLLALCLTLVGTKAQTLSEGSLDVLQSGSRVRAIIDFSGAEIMGMNEIDFSEFEEDWFKDKPGIQSRLLRYANAALAGRLFLGNYSHTEYTLRLIVLTVSDKGDYDCDAELLDAEDNLVATITGIFGPGGIIGTKLNLMKDGAKSTGAILGTFLRKNISN